mmetsp:Transcript_22904/g.23174  ORF Transcript_22904/g.23174 Transcript_22904/m.23174 type:complete len:89 (+) Transcript_22904:694-960(+)
MDIFDTSCGGTSTLETILPTVLHGMVRIVTPTFIGTDNDGVCRIPYTVDIRCIRDVIKVLYHCLSLIFLFPFGNFLSFFVALSGCCHR